MFAVLLLLLFAWQHFNEGAILCSQALSDKLAAFLSCYFRFPRGSNFFKVDFTDVRKYKTQISASEKLTKNFIQKLDAFSHNKTMYSTKCLPVSLLKWQPECVERILVRLYVFIQFVLITALKRNARALVMEWSKRR